MHTRLCNLWVLSPNAAEISIKLVVLCVVCCAAIVIIIVLNVQMLLKNS